MCSYSRAFRTCQRHHSAEFDRPVDLVIGFFTREQAEALVGYRGDDSLRNRIDELAERNTEGKLTDEEFAEYEGATMEVVLADFRKR